MAIRTKEPDLFDQMMQYLNGKDRKSPNSIRENSNTFPGIQEPMLCTLVKEPFDDENWLYEVKFDGFRIISYKNQDKITLRSRKLDYTKKFPSLIEELQTIDHDFIIDGEVIAVDDNGHPDFDLLQRYRPEEHDLIYYVFDIVWLDGKDLKNLPLTERRKILDELLPKSDIIKYSREFPSGIQLYDTIKSKGLEGIVAKQKDSGYSPGKRSKSWLKIPTKKVQDFVIGAWTESESGHPFRSMIFGNYVKDKFQYVGHCGHGFSDKDRKAILDKLKKLEIPKSPFSSKVETDTKAHWVKPELVASIEFSTWTDYGNIRKPAIFKGWRPDKDAKEVTPEEELTLGKKKQVINISQEMKPTKVISKEKYNTDSNWPKLEADEVTSNAELPIDGHLVKVTNLEKNLWEGVTKADLIKYYISIADYILPHLKDRPLSLHVKNLGPTAPGLYIKDMEGRAPDFATIHSTPRKHKKAGKRDMIDYLVCNNLSTLVYLINLGCIDVNPWMARTTSPLHPDFVNIDLDPSDNDFNKAIEAAKATKQILDKYKLKGFAKTSGKTGIHIYIPCSGFSFPDARRLSEKLGRELQELIPDVSTTEVSIKKRGTKLFIDPSQNDEADTLASAYSVRPFHIPTVSTPLDWKEIKPGLNPEQFTIHTILNRIKQKGELFKGIYDKKIIDSNNVILAKF